MKKIKLLLVLFFVVSIMISFVSAEEREEHIDNYVGDIMWKWYGGDWSTGKLPKVNVDDELIEGIDYKRSWAFTRNIVNDVSELNYLDEENAMNEAQYPGSVCEKIDGIGNYISSDVICHVVYGYTYIKVKDTLKFEGENDPVFEYEFVNYNGLDDDLSKYFDVEIEREEGETEGVYKITPKFKLKDESNITLSFVNDESRNSIQYVFKTLGRIIVEPVSAQLTIAKKEDKNDDLEPVFEEVIKKEEIPPHTDIILE